MTGEAEVVEAGVHRQEVIATSRPAMVVVLGAADSKWTLTVSWRGDCCCTRTEEAVGVEEVTEVVLHRGKTSSALRVGRSNVLIIRCSVDKARSAFSEPGM